MATEPALDLRIGALALVQSRILLINRFSRWLERNGIGTYTIEALERDEHGRAKYMGYVLQFGGWTIYHSGDTVRYEGMSEKLRPFKIDVALFPINGRSPERRVPGNLFGRESAQLAKDIEAKVAIPCHFEMFEFNTASPDEFVEQCRKLGQQFKVLRCGERRHN